MNHIDRKNHFSLIMGPATVIGVSTSRPTEAPVRASRPRAPHAPTVVLMGGAILTEVSGTAFLRLSEGLTRPGPVLGALVAYAVTTALFARILGREVRVGIAYGLLTGCGLLAATLLSVLVFGDTLQPGQLLGLAALGAGVLMLQAGRS